jgi:hypothetical protein
MESMNQEVSPDVHHDLLLHSVGNFLSKTLVAFSSTVQSLDILRARPQKIPESEWNIVVCMLQ